MNVKDYYTEQQAELILFCSAKGHRKPTQAIKRYNRWWYPRKETVEYSRVKNASDATKTKLLNSLESKDMESVDLNFDDYVNLSELGNVWPYTREYLYGKSVRMEEPEIEYRVLFGRTVFSIESIRRFLLLTDSRNDL